ncbi:hypothetical protein SARC_11970 [Sphaeroforma arctica JP610]|uniref:ABM domain-containing protein n=1 Tax=Sphaeroforma arctica JP610 TaxID=667725 RepID=A0A0L0FGB9_9EUKA|nr:hypothetical protein SARC_11970 [Sphaeroforma arctica JP610]KNC75506.1 hypothetical protein SARC_11970 [Sphaeroforma arctica JP610]|eukprot:XP_014149408.1 hypothetical protein SARC_11970 [Sphaeroforma arctica JP610]
MSSKQVVQLLPYFRVKNGGSITDEQRETMAQCVGRVKANETECLFYSFQENGKEFYCQEGYENADALKKHMANCGDLIGKLLETADLYRVEVHGPKEELVQLEDTLKDLNPTYWYRSGPAHMK